VRIKAARKKLSQWTQGQDDKTLKNISIKNIDLSFEGRYFFVNFKLIVLVFFDSFISKQ